MQEGLSHNVIFGFMQTFPNNPEKDKVGREALGLKTRPQLCLRALGSLSSALAGVVVIGGAGAVAPGPCLRGVWACPGKKAREGEVTKIGEGKRKSRETGEPLCRPKQPHHGKWKTQAVSCRRDEEEILDCQGEALTVNTLETPGAFHAALSASPSLLRGRHSHIESL